MIITFVITTVHLRSNASTAHMHRNSTLRACLVMLAVAAAAVVLMQPDGCNIAMHVARICTRYNACTTCTVAVQCNSCNAGAVRVAQADMEWPCHMHSEDISRSNTAVYILCDDQSMYKRRPCTLLLVGRSNCC